MNWGLVCTVSHMMTQKKIWFISSFDMMIFNLLSHTLHSEKGERARIHVKHTISFATLSCTFAWHFFWYFVWLLKMLRVVKIVRNKKNWQIFSWNLRVRYFMKAWQVSYNFFFEAMYISFKQCVSCVLKMSFYLYNNNFVTSKFKRHVYNVTKAHSVWANVRSNFLSHRIGITQKKLIWIWIQRDMLIPMNFKWDPWNPYVWMENLSGCKWNDTFGLQMKQYSSYKWMK